MPGKINLFNLGSLGVDLNTSPLHRADGSWELLQNGEFSPLGEEGAIKKRGSSNRVNSVAMTGQVLRMKNIPLDTGAFGSGGGGGGSVFGFPMLFGVNPDNPLTGGSLWYESDGTTFQPVSISILTMPSVDQATTTPNQRMIVARYGTTFYFINRGNDSDEAPKLLAYDGFAQTTRLSVFPTYNGFPADSTCTVAQAYVANGQIFFVLNYDTDFGVVYGYNTTNGLLTQLGDAIPLSPTISMCNLLSAFGTYFLGVQPGTIYRLVNGVWTSEFSSATLGRHIEFSPLLNGVAFAGMQAVLPASAVGAIRYREGDTDPLAAWADISATAVTFSDGGGSDQLAGKFTRFVVFEDAMYCHYRDPAPTSKMLRWVAHSSGWQEDADLTALFALADADEPGSPVVFDGSLYIPFMNGTSGFILKRTTGGLGAGTYTRPITAKNLQGTSGLIGVV